MKKHSKSLRRLRREGTQHNQITHLVLSMLIIVAIGVVFLLFGHAATPTASFEAESGQATANAQSVGVASASKGMAVKFGKQTTPTTGRFNVIGNQIIDPGGKIFLPMGANIAVSPGYTFNWRGVANGHVDDVKAWGWNTIRPTFVCESANGTNDMSSFYAGLDSIIQEYTAKQVVVMLECHDFTGKNPTDVSSLYAFWDRMTTKWSSNPYVWFNPVNEPYGNNDIEGWLSLQTTLLNRVRVNAPYNVFVADIPGYSQATETFKGANNITRLGTGKCNVIYSWHDYGAITDYNSNFDQTLNTNAQIAMFDYLKNNKIPVVIGELGDPLTLNEGTAGPPVWNRWGAYAAIDHAPQRGIGLLWWHATGDSGVFLTYALMADRGSYVNALPGGTGLSVGGQKFWNVSHGQPAPASYTGDLSASNCR